MFHSLCSVVSAAKETVAGNEKDYLSHIIDFLIVVGKDVDAHI
jgi:hypothetical protein